MTGNHQELNDSLRFQLSLLRLAVNPHANSSHNSPACTAAEELAKLAERVPVASGSQGD